MRIVFHVLLAILGSAPAYCLGQSRRAMEEIDAPPAARSAPVGKRSIVADVAIVGADGAPLRQVKTSLKTRPNLAYDPLLVESDVRTLLQSGYFYSAVPKSVETANGVYVKFEVREKPLIREIILIGNRAFSDKVLIKDLGFKVGDAIDPFTINEGKRRLEEYHHTRGFPKATVTINEGLSAKDRRVVYYINQGELERIGSVSFIGNDPRLASDGRLKSLVESKPGWFYYFGGKVDMQKIEADKEKLILYYRSLGYFDAKIDTMYEYDDNNKWMTLSFVINEGARFVITEIVLQGNQRFSNAELSEKMRSQEGHYFNQGKMEADAQQIRDRYGEIGHHFCDIQPNMVFADEPGELRLVFNILEGKPHHIEEIQVRIGGENPRTRDSVVLNRMMVYPGQILNTRRINNGIARVKYSSIFNTDPTMGALPEATVLPPSIQDLERYLPSSRPEEAPPGEAYTRETSPSRYR
jgi:outer membrane protein insertion porin family